MHQHCTRATVMAVMVVSVFAVSVARVTAQTPPDNTKINTRDRDTTAVTADQQKENAADRDLTQRVRRALMKDKTLSSYAHNLKIITQDGQVTLKGPVRTADEKATVERMTTDVAGAGHVTDQISIAPAKR